MPTQAGLRMTMPGIVRVLWVGFTVAAPAFNSPLSQGNWSQADAEPGDINKATSAIVAATAREYGQTVAEIRKRGAGNDARTMAVYLSRELGGHRQAEIGKAVGLEKTSSVSSAYLRMKAMMAQDRRLARRAARIKDALLKSKKRP